MKADGRLVSSPLAPSASRIVDAPPIEAPARSRRTLRAVLLLIAVAAALVALDALR